MPKSPDPVPTEITVSHNQGGTVAINDYGKRKSDWGIFMSQRYSIPEDWTQEDVDEFQKRKHDDIREVVDALDQLEHDIRWEAREWD